jgi:hypothetical protein
MRELLRSRGAPDSLSRSEALLRDAMLGRGADHFAVSVQLRHSDGGALVMARYGHPFPRTRRWSGYRDSFLGPARKSVARLQRESHGGAPQAQRARRLNGSPRLRRFSSRVRPRRPHRAHGRPSRVLLCIGRSGFEGALASRASPQGPPEATAPIDTRSAGGERQPVTGASKRQAGRAGACQAAAPEIRLKFES